MRAFFLILALLTLAGCGESDLGTAGGSTKGSKALEEKLSKLPPEAQAAREKARLRGGGGRTKMPGQK